jgi:[acyl-carrier-protein] S-malonyltransferase
VGRNPNAMGEIIMKNHAVLFAGQGAQAVGMGKDLAAAYPECAELFRKADAALGMSLSKLCFEGPIEELTKSSNCQPAIFVTSIACFRALEKKLGHPVAVSGMGGLSLGEWTALHASGALSFEDTLRVLQARGRFMQEACEEKASGMISVMGLSLDQAKAVCSAVGAEVANINSPGQIVLSAEKSRMGEIEKAAAAAGAKKCVVLNVAGGFHSSFMASAASRLESFLRDVKFASPTVPVVSNVSGAPHGGPDDIRRRMVEQVTGSVQWISCIEYFSSKGVHDYIELGPGKVLGGLIKRIDSAAVISNIQDQVTLDKVAGSLAAV